MSRIEFSEAEFFSRHFRLPNFTEETQQRLRDARVLIVGMGGLGCPAALYLAGAGVGKIGICDADTVSVANLHRQILYTTGDVGLKKVDVAARRLYLTNPFVKIIKIDHLLYPENAINIISDFDIVIDATDNHDAKYLLDDACNSISKPLVFGSIFQFEGQVSVFHVKAESAPLGLSYRDLYPSPPPGALGQNCGEAGVIGVLPGIVGMLQANETINLITGLGTTLAGTLLIFDTLSGTARRLKLSPCKRVVSMSKDEVTLTVPLHEAVALCASRVKPLLIDVREPSEQEDRVHGALHIPLESLPNRLKELPFDRDLILYCKSGVRSSRAALYLRSLGRFRRVFSLDGGVSPFAQTELERSYINVET